MRKKISFSQDQGGAAAVEFALVASMLLMTILFVLSAGLMLYLNQAMDYAAYKASRQIMVGNAQKAAATQSTFAATYVCPYLPAALSCSNLTVNVYTITEASQPAGYYTLVNSNQTSLVIPSLTGTTNFSLGTQGSYEYVQLVYPITFLPAAFVALFGNSITYNGSQAALIVSTAAFRNEQY